MLPSDLEGMPLTLLEAMSYGNCCLTSDIPECTEVCADYALSFKKGSQSDLKDKLEKLLSNDELVQNYKNRAQKYILEKYNWDEVCSATLSLYQR